LDIELRLQKVVYDDWRVSSERNLPYPGSHVEMNVTLDLGIKRHIQR